MRDLVWELHVANHFPSVWKPVNAFRLSKRVSGAPAANSLPPNCEAHFVTWSGRRRERSTPKNREQCCLSSCVQQKNRGNLFGFQSTSSPHTEGWTLHPPLPQPSSSSTSSSSSPPPSLSHPTTTNRGREKKKKKTCTLRAQLCMHFSIWCSQTLWESCLSPSSPSPHPSLLLLLFVYHVLGICSCFAQSSWSTPNAGYWV